MPEDEWSWHAVVGTLGVYNSALSVVAFALGSTRFGGAFAGLAAICYGAFRLLDRFWNGNGSS